MISTSGGINRILLHNRFHIHRHSSLLRQTPFWVYTSSYFATMSRAKYVPSSLTGQKPTCILVPPGNCQFTDQFQAVPLLERIPVSSTSSVLRFGLPDPSQPLSLSTCACLLAKADVNIVVQDNDASSSLSNDQDDSSTKLNTETVIRPYTPISTNAVKGYFDLLVKQYGTTAKMSHHLHTLKVGDTIDFKHIDKNVKIQAPFDPSYQRIFMLVGGTGITPMIQALHAILGDSQQKQHVTMIYGSQHQQDILGQGLIDNWAAEYADQFQVVHILSQEPKDSTWTGARGHMDRSLLEKYLPPDPPSSSTTTKDVLIFVCGPPAMYQSLCGPRDDPELTGLLAEMGYHADQVYKF